MTTYTAASPSPLCILFQSNLSTGNELTLVGDSLASLYCCCLSLDCGHDARALLLYLLILWY